ncbi:type VII secretion-associated serine protease mycosin [Nocardioides salsibiostraticola]
MPVRLGLAAGLIGVLGATPVLGIAPAYADGSDCSQIRSDTASEPTTTPSEALASLQIARAQQLLADRGTAAGRGQTVAVLDSGVAPALRVIDSHLTARTQSIDDAQGTALAGLIMGLASEGPAGAAEDESDPPTIGIAPAAAVVDVQVYDALVPDDGQAGVELPRVVAGLEWVAANARRLSIDVANVSVTLRSPDPTLETAVRAVRDAGVIVVASAGDLPAAEEAGSEVFLDEEGQIRPGIDARDYVWPAGYDDVVAVSASAPPGEDSAASVLQNSQIDIAVPTAGGVSYGLNGATCALPETSSRTAAAQISGILALIKSAYPKESNEQILARLYGTATGGGSRASAGVDPTHDLRSGAGIAQPVEALLRPLSPRKDGSVDSVDIAEEIADAVVAADEPDVLAQVREDAVWFGLLAGGLLAVALLLRPVLSRRR